MGRLPAMLTLALVALFPATSTAQVTIHDAGVRLLAKPFGIEKRIRLKSIDSLHAAADGSKRLIFSLENSGVREVTLSQPTFSFDLQLADGKWVSLGKLHGVEIVFPITESGQTLTRSYSADFTSPLSCDDLARYLKQAHQQGMTTRLLGNAHMTVRHKGKVRFSKKELTLELSGPAHLCKSFATRSHSSSKKMPAVGMR